MPLLLLPHKPKTIRLVNINQSGYNTISMLRHIKQFLIDGHYTGLSGGFLGKIRAEGYPDEITISGGFLGKISF